jgi:hypothetical protein
MEDIRIFNKNTTIPSLPEMKIEKNNNEKALFRIIHAHT